MAAMHLFSNQRRTATQHRRPTLRRTATLRRTNAATLHPSATQCICGRWRRRGCRGGSACRSAACARIGGVPVRVLRAPEHAFGSFRSLVECVAVARSDWLLDTNHVRCSRSRASVDDVSGRGGDCARSGCAGGPTSGPDVGQHDVSGFGELRGLRGTACPLGGRAARARSLHPVRVCKQRTDLKRRSTESLLTSSDSTVR
jgi:hypothetical protein